MSFYHRLDGFFYCQSIHAMFGRMKPVQPEVDVSGLVKS